jgi:hypothetical protein
MRSADLIIEEISDPTLGIGEITVDVYAAPVQSYTNEVLKTLPKVAHSTWLRCDRYSRAVDPDSTYLKIVDWVVCDPSIRSRDNYIFPDIAFKVEPQQIKAVQSFKAIFITGHLLSKSLFPLKMSFVLK